MAVNTIIEVEMTDGSIQKMTLNFKNLYLLRNKDKKTYDEYMRISNKGAKDEIEVAEMLYAAYRCANIDKECMSLEDFLEIHLNEVEDYFTYYVRMLGISEETFWNSDISFLRALAENISAYESWKTYVREVILENGEK